MTVLLNSSNHGDRSSAQLEAQSVSVSLRFLIMDSFSVFLQPSSRPSSVAWQPIKSRLLLQPLVYPTVLTQLMLAVSNLWPHIFLSPDVRPQHSSLRPSTTLSACQALSLPFQASQTPFLQLLLKLSRTPTRLLSPLPSLPLSVSSSNRLAHERP